MRFESDKNKAAENLKRHGVSFAEAEEVFDDFNALDDYDSAHSKDERRFVRIGLSSQRLLFVSYTVRTNGEEIYRLISARKATAKEERLYNDANQF
jgi:uncharacterized protein